MTGITHTKVSLKADDPDPTEINPSDWNAAHTIAPGTIGTTELATTVVTPGTYSFPTITVGVDGRLTAAANGSPGSIGPGTNNTVIKFSGTSGAQNSGITDDGTTVTVAEALRVGQLNGTVISPATITGTVNDYAPTGLSGATTVLVASSSGIPTITGLSGGVDGRMIKIYNIDASNDLLIACNNAGSAAANRITGPWGTVNLTLPAGTSSNVSLQWNSSSSRWQVTSFTSNVLPSLAVTGTLTPGALTSTSGMNALGSQKWGVTTDTTSSGLVNNYALPANTSILKFAKSGADVQLTGMAPGVAGQVMLVLNESPTSNNLYAFDSNTNSLLTNRFRIGTTVAPGGGAQLLLAAGAGALVFFDGSNWWWMAMWNAIVPGTQLTALGDVTATGNMTASGFVTGSTGLIVAGVPKLNSSAIVASSAAIANTEAKVVSMTIPANTLTAGMVFNLRGFGTRNATLGTAQIGRIRIGPTTLTGAVVASVATALDTVSVHTEWGATLTIRSTGASGSAIGAIEEWHWDGGVPATVTNRSAVPSPVTIDTTVSNFIEFTYISGNASVTSTFTQACLGQVF